MATKKTLPTDFEQPTYTAPYFKTEHANATYLGDPHVDNLMLIVYELATELWSEKERSRIVESLLQSGTKVTEDAIQSYTPSDEQIKLWKAEQGSMTRRIFSCLGREAGATREFSTPRFSDRHRAKQT